MCAVLARSDEVFEFLLQTMDYQGERMTQQAKAVFQFKIIGGNNWVLDLKSGRGKAYIGVRKCDLTLTLTDDDFVALAEGKLNSLQAMMQGKLKIQGDIGLAQKLDGILAACKHGKVEW
eukprot:GEMP01025809.1.p2 GENE.GEMP01025809.1~~GEMP01025809.1.p2  ORF type:complete len:119 (-),score=31.92 GEMP01025809.1:1956-2312(-)